MLTLFLTLFLAGREEIKLLFHLLHIPALAHWAAAAGGKAYLRIAFRGLGLDEGWMKEEINKPFLLSPFIIRIVEL